MTRRRAADSKRNRRLGCIYTAWRVVRDTQPLQLQSSEPNSFTLKPKPLRPKALAMIFPRPGTPHPAYSHSSSSSSSSPYHSPQPLHFQLAPIPSPTPPSLLHRRSSSCSSCSASSYSAPSTPSAPPPTPSDERPKRPALKRRDTPRPLTTAAAEQEEERSEKRQRKNSKEFVSVIDAGVWTVLE